MICDLVFVTEEENQFVHRCSRCGVGVRSRYRDPQLRRQQCLGKDGQEKLQKKLMESVLQQIPCYEQLKEAATSRGMLVGDIIKTMTETIGFPPCRGCESRRIWANKVHLWVRDWLNSF